MNGAESLVETLASAGVEVCFANPGTSEMHFVGALDRVEGMRCVLGLFEGVCSGAASVAVMAGGGAGGVSIRKRCVITSIFPRAKAKSSLRM